LIKIVGLVLIEVMLTTQNIAWKRELRMQEVTFLL